MYTCSIPTNTTRTSPSAASIRRIYRDTAKDRDVYNSSFLGTLAKPSHYVEYLDYFKGSDLLTRAFALRKDGRLPNHVIRELLPHLIIQAR